MVFLGEVDINDMVFLGVEDINCHGVSFSIANYKLSWCFLGWRI